MRLWVAMPTAARDWARAPGSLPATPTVTTRRCRCAPAADRPFLRCVLRARGPLPFASPTLQPRIQAMTTANLRSLVAHLNDTCRRALEAAAGLCLSRTQYNIEVEHWLLKILESPKSDLVLALRHFEIDPARVEKGLVRALDRLKTGNSRPPALAPSVVDLAREAWLVGSLEFDATAVRSGHVLCALMSADGLAHQMTQACPE